MSDQHNGQDHKAAAENEETSFEQELGPDGQPVVVQVEEPKQDDRLARLMAEFDNYRKRTAKDSILDRQRGRRDAASKFLPVLDSVDMALLSMAADSPFRSGLEGVRQQVLNAFEGLGLKKIPTVGQAFDPQLHEAIARMPHPEAPEGTITAETRAGFTDEVGLVRAAQVLVSAGNS
jgi:molecular chaperone GrpE